MRSELDETVEGIKVVNKPTRKTLTSEKKYLDYHQSKANLIKWLVNEGKSPDRVEGYAKATVRQVSQKTDQFYRWQWDETGRYTTSITTGDADEYVDSLIYDDKEYTNSHLAGVQKCLKRVFKWQRHCRGSDEEWDPDRTFSESATKPRDYLTMDERKKIREAALEYGSIPSYDGVTPEERDRWKSHLAQRFEKPKSEVTPDDWERANGWKIPSIVWVSLDAGLRPIEVERAVTSWVDTENAVLRIPKGDSSKNRDNWTVGLTERTAAALDRWLDEREMYDQYEDTDDLWLTRQANSYNSQSLRYVLHQLCDIAGISTENRSMSWYSIRHSVGTFMTREEDLAAAQAQLRHKSPDTTMQYDSTPVEDRRDALDKMG